MMMLLRFVDEGEDRYDEETRVVSQSTSKHGPFCVNCGNLIEMMMIPRALTMSILFE